MRYAICDAWVNIPVLLVSDWLFQDSPTIVGEFYENVHTCLHVIQLDVPDLTNHNQEDEILKEKPGYGSLLSKKINHFFIVNTALYKQ